MDRISLVSWIAAGSAGALTGGFFLNLYWPPNQGETALSVGAAIAVMVVLRRVVASELEKHHESK